MKSGIPGVICKIDFEKTFDNVSWEFVDEVMQKMRVGELWRKWIHGCINNTPFFVLINGSYHTKFITGKGLTQGDTLSPFLFMIVSEALNLMLQLGHEQEHIGGFAMNQNGFTVSYLQYADDTLVFLDESPDQMNYLRYYLIGFEMVSGLKINFAKCGLFGVAGARNIDSMTAMLGCKTEILPSSYLCIPLGDSSSSIKWEALIEKCKSRLCSWKRSSLSKAGKLNLTKSVVSSILIYMLSLFIAPPKVIKVLEKVIRDFLWDPSETKKGYHYVSWKKCRTPLKSGGLGIKSLKNMNRALISKWWWRFNKEKTALWRKAMTSKYNTIHFERETEKPKPPNKY
ncbi:uncharacterized protein LOC113359036 [Papaver somniferum]|uniref:uncharacterized protein LOC113359036 n=1 Tax=Papaver somniferum TaxID=3469 RepID=UPI000E6F8C89|nr:uncharacterized protein LOC113359036 [Papaver somniferum]